MSSSERIEFTDMGRFASSEIAGISDDHQFKERNSFRIKFSTGFILVLLALILAAGVGLIVHFAENRKVECNFPDKLTSSDTEPFTGQKSDEDACKNMVMQNKNSICNVCPKAEVISTTHSPLVSTSTLPPTSSTLPPPSSTLPLDSRLKNIRLPKTLIPIQYDLDITPYMYGNDEEKFYFRGKLGISIRCNEATKVITLHSNMLDITFPSVKITSSDIQVLRMITDRKRQFIHFYLSGDLIKGNIYNLYMDFTGPLKTDLKGFYLSSYMEKDQKRYLATTQFQPTDARKAFPCFDEPEFKAVFNITIGRKVGWHSLSNTEITSTYTRLTQEKQDKKNPVVKEESYRIIDTGNGIRIFIYEPQKSLPKDQAFISVPCSSEERADMLQQIAFPEKCQYLTDVFQIKDSNDTHSFSFTEKDTFYATVKVKVEDMDEDIRIFLKFTAIVRFNNEWSFISAAYNNGTVEFNVRQMDSLFIICSPLETQHKVSTHGGDYISEGDKRLQIQFPPNAVTQNIELNIQVQPIYMDYIVQKYEVTTDDDNPVVAVSPCLSSTHYIFQQPVQVLLPLLDLPDTYDPDQIYEPRVLKCSNGGNFEVTDIVPEIKMGVGCFAVFSFSSYAIAIIKKKRRVTMCSVAALYEEATRLKMWCKILFFVCQKTQHSVIIILECVEKRKLEHVIKSRKQYGFHLVSEWISKDFFFEPGKKISVDVKGKFSLPKRSLLKKIQVTFFPAADDNFTRFQVDLNPKLGEEIYGVLLLRDGNDVLDEIFYDPWSTKKCLPNISTKSEQKGISSNRDGKGAFSQDLETDFFTEAGIMAVTEFINPDSLYKTVINLGMTSAQYDKICDQFPSRSMPCRQNVTLLKTALDKQKPDNKLNSLIQALSESGERILSERIESIHNSGQDLLELRK